MTIDPTGLITLCCNFNNGYHSEINRTLPLTHIQDIDDIYDFFLKEYQMYNYVNKTHGWEALPECSECVVQKISKVSTTKGWYDDVFKKPYTHYDKDLKLRLLEVTSSNICNQMCATCGPYFSTKWIKNISKVFPTRPYSHEIPRYLSRHDVDKIVRVIPQLEVLMLKGGEPFADQNNLKFLKATLSAPAPMNIIIVSNMHEISDAFLNTLLEIKNYGHAITLSASIDATGDLYDWVRDGPWQQTSDTCKRFVDTLDVAINISSTVSCFTFPYLNEIYQQLTDCDWSGKVRMPNIVRDPSYCSPSVFKQEFIDGVIRNCVVPGWKDKYIKSFDDREAQVKRTVDYINRFNNVRTKKFLDIKPEFENYLA